MDNNLKEVLKNSILECMQEHHYMLFADVENYLSEKGLDFNGNTLICRASCDNIIYWCGWSEEAVEAIKELVREKEITFLVGGTVHIEYFVIGKILNMPVCKNKNYNYKKMHWLPCAISYCGDINRVLGVIE